MKKDFNKKLIIGFSLGDYNGIGPEILLKAFSKKKLFKKCIPIVFCNIKILEYYKNLLKISVKIKKWKSENDNYLENTIYTHDIKRNKIELSPGKKNKNSGIYAVHSLINTLYWYKEKIIDGIVTLPINKNNSQSKYFNYPGHTEFFQDNFDSNDSMMIMHSNKMILGFVTGHIAIKELDNYINKKTIESKFSTFIRCIETDFLIKNPRIAVLGLNPHCGEDGLLGNEELNLILPTINKINKNKKILYGLFSADSFFGMKKYKEFDAIISFYHDQGLVGFKSICFDKGVNYTAGLPCVRTSPDHGTAFNISGKGIANEKSLIEAIKLNMLIINNRKF